MSTQDTKAKMVDLYGKISAAKGGEEIKNVRSEMLDLCKGNKSEVIRVLHSLDLTRSQIAKIVDVRYQFVNNVIAEILRKRA